MKIFMIECTEDELRANRGIMDAVVDACHGLLSGLYGNCNPCCEEDDENEAIARIKEQSEDKE